MKKILLFAFLLFAGGLFAQTPYDTVNVRDPQNFVEMTSVDTAYFQLIGRKANLNRRMSLTTLKNWILSGVSGIDTVYWSGDTLNILQGLTLWQAVADDNSGLFDADNNGDTIRVSTALLRAAFNLTGGAYGMNISSSSVPFSTTSTGNVAGWFTSGNSGTTTYMNVLDVSRTTTGTAAAGLGGRIRYILEADNGGTTSAGYLGVKWTSAAFASPTSAFEVRLLDSGTEYTRLSLAGSGQLTLDGYAANALNNVDSSLYVLAVDASGDVHTRAASGLGGDGNGLIDALPAGDVMIFAGRPFLPQTNTLGLFSNFYNVSFNEDASLSTFLLVADSLGIGGSVDSIITDIPNIQDSMGFLLSTLIPNSSQGVYILGLLNKLKMSADTLDATGVTTFLGLPSESIDSISYYGDTLRIYEGGDLTPFKAEIVAGADTDDQTLSTSNDTLTISGGNSVRVPGNGFIRDSITSTTLTVDLAHHNNAVVVLKMESATNLTLTINNPWSAVSGSYPNQSGETGVYTFHFRGISGTDNVTWPANFYDMGGTALGTDALTAGTAYTCYYDPVATNYYCK